MINFEKSPLEMNPVDIFKLLDSEFGGEPWIGWEPDTIEIQLPDDLGDLGIDKILAVHATAHNLRNVSEIALGFENVVTAFSNQQMLADAMQPPNIEEIFYAVRQIKKIAALTQENDSFQQFKFRGQVPGYVAATARYHNWIILPAPLNFAQATLDFLNGLKYRRSMDQKLEKACAALEKLADDIDAMGDIGKGAAKMLDVIDQDEYEYRNAAMLIGCYLYKPEEIRENG